MRLQHEVEINRYKCEILYMEQNESWIKFSNEILTVVSQTINSIKQWQTKKKKSGGSAMKKVC